MQTKAYSLSRDILKRCKGSVLVGTSAFYDEPTNVNRDIDIALNFEVFVQEYTEYKSLEGVKCNQPEWSEGRLAATYTFNGITIMSKYIPNEKSRWIGIETITFSDDSRIDLLFYSIEDLVAVRDTMKNMLLLDSGIWSPESKDSRVVMFENSISTMVKTKQ